MNAAAIVCDENQNFTLSDVILPDPAANNVVIRTLYSGISIGTEMALVRNKISWGPFPICTGYMATGVIEHSGEKVGGFRPGERVYYRDNLPFTLADGRKVSPVAGTHCGMAVIDPEATHGLAHLPDGVAADVGSFFVMPSVGLFGVDMSNPRLGDVVVVYGAGLIGLGVVGWAAMRGCVVVALDIDASRLEVARQLGADHCINGSEADVDAEVRRIAPDGADVVFESTGLPACIDPAIALCRKGGTFVWQGNYGAEPISMSFLPPHARHLRMYFPCDDGLAPARRTTLKNIASGALRWERTITHRVPPAEAPDLFHRINTGQAPEVLGATIHWSD